MNRLSPLLALAVVLAPSALQAQSPWSRVPPAPSSCYWDSAFSNSVSSAKQKLDAEISRQDALNDSVAHMLDSQEGGGKMAAMQAAMMKDPAGAQKLLAAIGDMGTEEYQNEQMKVLKRQEELEGQFSAVDSAFRTAAKKATDPILTEWGKRPNGEGSVAATPAELAAVKKRFETAYTPVCAQYYQSGKFTQWLATYKDYFVTQYIPANEKTFTTKRDMYAFYGVNTANYKSTVTMKAVSDYLGFLGKVYGVRLVAPKFN